MKASLVPDVGGGPITTIGAAGKAGFTSFHILYGFGLTVSPLGSAGTSFAKARYTSLSVNSRTGPLLALAIAIPSNPTLISVISVTPFFAHFFTSLLLILLEAFVISGCSVPRPLQKSFNPPPDPVDSITGVLNPLVFPNLSATTVAKG